MAFKIAARTLLELGSELISSDGIAVYELIKNAVDAGSETVEVHVVVAMTHTHYDMALKYMSQDGEEVDLQEARERILGYLEEGATEEALGDFRSRIAKARNIAQLEAALTEAYDACNWIQVKDTGHGMSLKELDEIYLTIGTRTRRQQKRFMADDDFDFEESPEPVTTILGDKGIGRLSAMRLGERLNVKTTTSKDTYWNVLDIDWEDFGHDIDKMVDEIDVTPKRGPRKSDKSLQGMTVTIRHLKSDWTERTFLNIVDSDFSRLVDPFQPRRGNKLLRLFFNGQRRRVPEIPKRLLENAHGWGRARFVRNRKSKQLVLRGEIGYPLRGDWNKIFRLIEPELFSLLAGTKDGRTLELPQSALEKLGRFKVEFYWYNRRILTEIDGLGTRRDVQREVARWAGGLMVFRDSYRVNPYGGPNDDWLELDKRAFAAKGYKVNRNQIVGRVNVSWRNRFLVDQTNREGLVDTNQKAGLRRLLQHILTTEFKPFLDQVDAEVRAQATEDLDTIDIKIELAKTEVERAVLELIRDVPEKEEALSEIRT